MTEKYVYRKDRTKEQLKQEIEQRIENISNSLYAGTVFHYERDTIQSMLDSLSTVLRD